VISVNGADHDFDEVSIDQLIDAVGIERRGIAVARNGEIVRRSEWSSTLVRSGDQIEIVTAAAGG
jgi:sulfur carrier protein